MYQGAVEVRFRRWFRSAASPSSRLIRLALLAAPFFLALLASVPACPSAALLRTPCPGCGLTRATLALLQGDLPAASALNPLALIVCPLLGGALLYAAFRYVATGKVGAQHWRADVILVGSMICLTIVWSLRWFGLFGGPVAV